MAAQDGKLTPEDKDKIIKWLTEKTKEKGHHCNVCGTNRWGIGDHLISGDIYRGGNLFVGGEVYPLVFLLCQNCLHVQHFMAIPLGIISEGPKPEETEQAEEKKGAT